MKKLFKNEILRRAMIAFDCKKVNDIAMLLNISPQNLNGYIDRGSFIKLIEPELYKRKININWIKTGQGSMEAPGGYGFGTYVGESNLTGAEPQTPYNQDNSDLDLIRKTADILKSPTVYSAALKSNIEAFHHAMTCEKQLAVSNKKIDKPEEQAQEIKDRLPAAGE